MSRFKSRLVCASLLGSMAIINACATKDTFNPKSGYPPDPWVKGYSNPDDCIGGEQLAAVNFELPDYPTRAFNTGRQGWVIIRLDVDAGGQTQNINVERSVPAGLFEKASRNAVDDWTFQPPKSGALTNCRILLRYRFGSVSLG